MNQYNLFTCSYVFIGLIPSKVKDQDGNFTIKKVLEKYSSNQRNQISSNEQERLSNLFFSKPSNKLYKPGSLCIPDVIFTKKIQKGAAIKRALLCYIKRLDFERDEPVLFELETVTTKKILHTKFYKNEIHLILKSPSKNSLFYKVLDVRGKEGYVEAQILLKNGNLKWVICINISINIIKFQK